MPPRSRSNAAIGSRACRYRNGEAVGKIARRFADDLDALDAAYEVCAQQAVDVWQGDRLVASVRHGETKLVA